jgi:N-acetylneuraminate synthase
MIFVADIGINHNGDIKIVKEMIDACKAIGCDYVKFQKRTPELCVPDRYKDVRRETPWGNISYMEYREKIELGRADYDFISDYCKQIGMKWFASVWDTQALDFIIYSWNVPFIKIPSACITDIELLQSVGRRSAILSTGMSTVEEVDAAVRSLKRLQYLLACTSTYPTPKREVNLRYINVLQYTYPQYSIGFSNHFPGLTPMIGAAALGAQMIEFHITLSRAMWGSDQAASIEVIGAQRVIGQIKDLLEMMGKGDKIVFPSEQEAKERLRK